MSLRVNINKDAWTAQHNLGRKDEKMPKALKQLSSRLKINTAADGPATLVISDKMRAQISGVNQAIDNNETAVSLVQTAKGALSEVNRLLIDIRQRAIHAANEGLNDHAMLKANQEEIENALDAIDRIAQQTQFGHKRLLDGSRAITGSATDEVPAESGQKVIEFVGASASTLGSTKDGYEVVVTRNATQAGTFGKLTEAQVKQGMLLFICADGKRATYATTERDTVQNAIEGLKAVAERACLNVAIDHEVATDDPVGRFFVKNKGYGRGHNLQVRSSAAGVFENAKGRATLANEEVSLIGADVLGTINGEPGVGQGQLLTGRKGNRTTAGLTVKINEAVELRQVIGTVKVEQNALKLQIGASAGQTVSVAMLDTHSTQMARQVSNESGFSSLADVDVRNGQGAKDTIRLVDHAMDELSSNQGELGAFQRNTLESNLSRLQIAMANLTAAESTLKDAEKAKQLTELTKHQILTQAATAQLAQAHATPRNMLTLLASQRGGKGDKLALLGRFSQRSKNTSEKQKQ